MLDKNDLFLVWGSIDLAFVRVVEIDLVFVRWPKITWFECEHRTDFVFVWVVEIDLVSLWGIGLDLISVQ